MIDLFSKEFTTRYPVVTPPQLEYVKKGLTQDFHKLQAYYTSTNRWVANQHILVRLLLTLNVSLNRRPELYADVVADTALSLYAGLGLTSPSSQGTVHNIGTFYNRNVVEVLIAANEEFDPVKATEHWIHLEPVRVLRHPYTDLSMEIPDGRYPACNENPLAVIAINIPMLAIQYRAWRLSKGRVRDDGSEPPVHEFIYSYVLVNMLLSHLNVAMQNRLQALYRKLPVADFTRVHPCSIIDYSARFDQGAELLVSRYQREPMHFPEALRQMIAIDGPSMLEALKLPTVAPTRHIVWALLIARLPQMQWLIDIGRDTNNHKNVGDTGQFHMQLRELISSNALGQGLPLIVTQEWQAIQQS
jgi:hypothetical protein